MLHRPHDIKSYNGLVAFSAAVLDWCIVSAQVNPVGCQDRSNAYTQGGVSRLACLILYRH